MGVEQSPVLQEGAVHGGPAAAKQHGQRFRGQGDPQVEHGGQDLFKETEPGRSAALEVAVRGQSFCQLVQLLAGHPGQLGIKQRSLIPLPGGFLRAPGRRDGWGG
ncbi:hypothetical protein GCM10020295_02210 [Streptomyces cinereospinus]